MSAGRGRRAFAFVMLALLAAALVATVIFGISLPIMLLVRLGVLPASSLNPATVGPLSFMWFSGGLIVLIVGAVLLFAHNIARKGAWLFASGVVLLVAGTGPLWFVGLASQFGLSADPNPNPIFLGILAFLTFLPAMFLVVSGAILFVVGKVRHA
jgi:hypothetical protein